jgi:FkbM family methyltransferase
MRIAETQSVWDFLKESHCGGIPIYLYGMGDGADKILQVLSQKGIDVSGVYASDEFVRGQHFRGFKVKKLAEVEARHEHFVSVLAFGSNRPDVMEHIVNVASTHPLVAPDVAVCGFSPDAPFDYAFFKAHESEFERVYELLSDERSKRLFEDVINFKINGKLSYIMNNTDTLTDIFRELPLSGSEVFADAGAYDGDSITAFEDAVFGVFGVFGKYKHIHAFEPGAKVFKRLTANVGDKKNVTLTNAAAWSSNTGVSFNDTGNRNAAVQIAADRTPAPLTAAVRLADAVPDATLVKMDVEGAEKHALKGLEPLIRKGVKLVCAVYHKNGDLFSLPLYLHEQNPDYRFKLRRVNCFPAWDIFLCASEI